MPIRRFILTGAPGAGKTTIIDKLGQRGFDVVAEAATDVIASSQERGIAEPWKQEPFIDAVVDLQCRRQIASAHSPVEVQFHDRSVVCTYALARFLKRPVSRILTAELLRIEREKIFERRVFLIESLGFVAPTAARRISLDEALRFEAMHAAVYRQWGYEVVGIPPADIASRIETILRTVAAGMLPEEEWDGINR